MLATLTDDRFSDPRWIFEPKFDGVRCLVFRDRRGVRLLSRNKLSLNRQYPEIEEAFRAEPAGDYILDGEVVAFEGKRTSFARLQRRMQLRDPARAKRTGVAVYFYAFDIVYAGGFDLTRLPLLERKLVLRRVLSFNRRLRFTAHRVEDGEQAWRDACANGLEGVIAKRADSPYEHGRSRDWLKFKCVNEQELVIGGYTEPAGARVGLGALLLGYYDDGASLCGQGRHGVRCAHSKEPLDAPRLSPPGAVAIRPRQDAGPRRALGKAGPRRANRIHRMDARRAAPTSALPRAAPRQTGAGGGARAPSVTGQSLVPHAEDHHHHEPDEISDSRFCLEDADGAFGRVGERVRHERILAGLLEANLENRPAADRHTYRLNAHQRTRLRPVDEHSLEDAADHVERRKPIRSRVDDVEPQQLVDLHSYRMRRILR